MTTIAIIGAGEGLGAAVARRFGRVGFSVALISREQGNVDRIADSLGDAGITAAGFAADVRNPESLTTALDSVAERLGPIEVLQYSPVPAREFMKPVLETRVADLVGPVEFSIYGPVTAVNWALPGMRSLGRGTVLFVNGGSAVRPGATVAGTSVVFAGESAYAQLLHDALAPEGLHVGQLIIPRGIGAGEPSHEPDALAELLWTMHTERGEFRTFAAPLD
ncbi:MULTISPECIES: SDR family NAD(P)-dependent oxidoreductase [unclassified Rhodococcus (in: high G+C Gram-positive bacteria)]|uniref:SDR family NAD(P)-dependent oxidoreductase n=1 Tax=unclassified Rhodococcus (in: high G+C Gram-positive bacteria) TaxID=192944 RepID=UPI0006FC502F|nr:MULTISPECIES: SDR family NAD(P)-dependent oxidoreductase [unclassified Rhodococcus (in: high G+C Gram-positive bacteria)]KQU39122.1 dehydrogenase [Rhodococcus sp. Leaf225]KQU43558.1 dehydrogenase [Rhodococcus sp. Leaf258]